MLRKRWIYLVCALVAAPLLYGLHAVSAEMAWVLFLASAALIVVSVLFGECGRRRPSLFPFQLRGDPSEETDQHRDTPTTGGKTQPFQVETKARTR
jgi:uncharacterized membrane protein YtjA (UPF0391 family)